MSRHVIIHHKSLLIMLIAFLLIYGCVGPIGRTEGKLNNDYRSGKEGIELSFLPDSPAQKIYELTNANIQLKLENRGAYDDPEGFVVLSGFDPEIIKITETKKSLPSPFAGKSQYLPKGTMEILRFDESGKIELPYSDSYKPTLMASACYKYKTIATPTVCIMPKAEYLVKEPVCRPGTTTMSSQGAPVAVTKVEEELMLDKVNFIITIENIGNGYVFDESKIDSCPFSLSYKDMDIVELKAKINGLGEAECTPSNKIRLVDGTGTVYCNFVTRDPKSVYSTSLYIELSYGYYSTIKKQIEIVKLPGTKAGLE